MISEHRASLLYRTAMAADAYYHMLNPTIMRYQKLVYNVYGKAVPDIWSPNHKVVSNWYFYFVDQSVAHLLSNGVYLSDTGNKKKLGKNFDRAVSDAAVEAKNGGMSFGFWNLDHLEVFSVREFVPLWDERSGALASGIRFTQIDADKPMYITLYEPDGYTEYKRAGDGDLEVTQPKRDYKQHVKRYRNGSTEVTGAGNYGAFPIVPLFNILRQSELVGNQSVIDAYDLIASGLINNTDDGNFIYWILKNCDGMNEEDDEKFIEQLKMHRFAHANGDDGAGVEAHSVEAPVDAHKLSLEELRSLLFTNFMAVDVSKISAGGGTTATEIRAAYEPLNSKTDLFEHCVTDFIERILELAEIDDVPTYERSQIVNQLEQMEMLMMAAPYLDAETLLRKMPVVTVDEVPDILARKLAEDAARYPSTAADPDGE